MSKKIIILILIVLVFIFGIVAAYAVENNDSNNVTETILNVSSEGPYPLPRIINDIKNHPLYYGNDNETLSWMESLGNKSVFMSREEVVIMDKEDADKIPSVFVEDAFFKEIFSCNVLENHSLGDDEKSKDVLLVNNVEFISEELHFPDI